ncbi:MAG: STAS/SEC14 domain-containing protein [Dehalococcoidia bacterium]|nr:STAS/SEC14 domain-containing protein [Dehalococcoidia bacterium]
MLAKWMERNGRKILYVDFRDLSSQEILLLMKESDSMVLSSPQKVLYLGNIENAAVSREVMKQLRQYADKSVRKRFEKLAVVGVTGVKKVFFDAFVSMMDKSSVQVKSFSTEGEALEWLVE